jgi:hypothetical protein
MNIIVGLIVIHGARRHGTAAQVCHDAMELRDTTTDAMELRHDDAMGLSVYLYTSRSHLKSGLGSSGGVKFFLLFRARTGRLMSGLSSCEERDVRFGLRIMELRNRTSHLHCPVWALDHGARTGHCDVRFEISQVDVRFEHRNIVPEPEVLEPEVAMSGSSSSAGGMSGSSSKLDINQYPFRK